MLLIYVSQMALYSLYRPKVEPDIWNRVPFGTHPWWRYSMCWWRALKPHPHAPHREVTFIRPSVYGVGLVSSTFSQRSRLKSRSTPSLILQLACHREGQMLGLLLFVLVWGEDFGYPASVSHWEHWIQLSARAECSSNSIKQLWRFCSYCGGHFLWFLQFFWILYSLSSYYSLECKCRMCIVEIYR